jgi:NAD(P)-dependent dehydrogenase (short-subunit alcohol dehydrogenase family)
VAVADLDGDAASRFAMQIDSSGSRVMAVEVDVASASSVRNLFELVLARFSAIDIVVNNAGGGNSTPFMDISEDGWDRMFDLNAKSVFLCCQQALQSMLPRKSGKIINIASSAGRSVTQVAGPHYGASKAAVIGLTRNLAREVGPHGINVNAICPGIVATERLMKILEQSGRVESSAQAVPLRRLGTPQDIAGG